MIMSKDKRNYSKYCIMLKVVISGRDLFKMNISAKRLTRTLGLKQPQKNGRDRNLRKFVQTSE